MVQFPHCERLENNDAPKCLIQLCFCPITRLFSADVENNARRQANSYPENNHPANMLILKHIQFTAPLFSSNSDNKLCCSPARAGLV